MSKLEFLLVAIISLFILALSFYPILYRYQTTPADRNYVGTTYFTEDYAGYVSVIEQGIKGNLLSVDKFTSENMPGTLQYYPYLIMGRLAGILSLSSVQMYHLTRFVFGLVYLITIYYFVRCGIGTATKVSDFVKRMVAFILVVFSNSFPVINNSKIDVPVISRISAELQAVNRFVIQPHYILGNLVLILCLALFINHLQKPHFKNILIISVSVFLTTFFRPLNMLLLVGIIAGYFVLNTLITKKLNRGLFVTVVLSSIMFLPGYLYLDNLKLSYPYLPYFQFDLDKTRLFDFKDWLLVQGPVLVLALLALIKVKKHDIKSITVLTLFVVINLFLTFILPNFYQINPLRTIQTPMFAVLSLLAVMGIFKITRNIIFIIIITIIMIIISLPTNIRDFNHEVHLYYDAYYIWPPKTYDLAFSYLAKNTSPKDIVLTYHSLSNLVPMLCGNTIYWGHTNETLNYNEKKKQVESFYRGDLSLNAAQKFLTGNKIKYVLRGREEKDLGSLPKYFFLNKIVGNGDIEIYKVE